MYYIKHYFSMPEFLYFFLVTFGVVLAEFLLIFAISARRAKKAGEGGRSKVLWMKFNHTAERYYELIFSGTSILLFIAAYYLIERFLEIEPYREFWDRYSEFLLMGLIVLSILLNNFLDHVLIRFRQLDPAARTSVRIIGMLYMGVIFLYVKYIYENNNYDRFILYFLTLMIGRFVYFDASIRETLQIMKEAFHNFSLMIMALPGTGLICLYGFKTKYLLIHNGVITNVFIAHLFMCMAIFVLSRFHIADQVYGRRKRKGRKGAVNGKNESGE